MKTYNISPDVKYNDFTSSSIGTRVYQSTADPINLSSTIIYTGYLVVNKYVDRYFDIHELDTEIEKILEKFEPAIRELTAI